MSTPGGRRRDALGLIHSSSRRPTQKQLREAASQLSREGQLLWLVGEGLHVALTLMDGAAPSVGLVDALRDWAGGAVRAAGSMQQEVLSSIQQLGDTVSVAAGGARSSHGGNAAEATNARMLVAWVSSQTVRGSWVTLAVGADRQGCKKALALHEGSTSDPVVARKVIQEVMALADPCAGLLLITDGTRTLDEMVAGHWTGVVQVGHCHLRMRDDVVAHVPKDERAELADALALAWRQPVDEAARTLHSMVTRMRRRHPGAAERLERGIEASLRVAVLGVQPPLRRHLESAGVARMAIENALKWGRSKAGGAAAVAAGLPVWQQRTRRLMGWRGLAALAETLQEKAAAAP